MRLYSSKERVINQILERNSDLLLNQTRPPSSKTYDLPKVKIIPKKKVKIVKKVIDKEEEEKRFKAYLDSYLEKNMLPNNNEVVRESSIQSSSVGMRSTHTLQQDS